MASVLELILQEKATPCEIFDWLKNRQSSSNKTKCLEDLGNLKQEFIPFFLNYLRDHTFHLIQSNTSSTPSPAKTPSLKRIQKSVKRGESNKKRQQLFGASPASAADDDLGNLPSSVFSPNTSLESPGLGHTGKANSRDRQFAKGHGKFVNQKSSPQCGSQKTFHNQQTPEQRSKQKLSLAEFLFTPEQNKNASSSWKKKSPHSAGKKEYSNDNSFHGRKSSGKKRHSYSPLVLNSNNISNNCNVESNRAFSLSSNDFPPMCSSNERKTGKNNRRSLDSLAPSKANNCDNPKSSRVINFSSKCDNTSMTSYTHERLKEVKRISPVTIQTSTPNVRRVTPTFVKVDSLEPQNSAFLVPIDEREAKSKAAPWQTKQTGEMNPLEEEKGLFKEQRSKCESGPPSDSSSLLIPTPTKPELEHSGSLCEITEAILAEVTHQDKLDLLVDLYALCLDGNLFPNVVVELYFLVQLLTARGGEMEATFVYGDDVIEENFLSSIHNTVYFAVSVLEREQRLLMMLDKCTLHLMLENPRVAKFSADLQHFLEGYYDKAESAKGPAFPRSPIGSVSFQADTDNRNNFPSDKSFHLFKRQRDGFYELLREWEASRMNPSYNMAEMFGGRVKTIIGAKTELANLIHFARLFQSQLIATCRDGNIRSSEDDENIALLRHLKRTNPEKFKKLQERFIKPLNFGGPCPSPSFPGIQEFFRDFIVVAANPLLNQHLSDIFTAKIKELNDVGFSTHDDEDAANTHDEEEEKEEFSNILLSLRLVGKFLGFMSFLPYESPSRIPETMEAMYIGIRNTHVPTLDLVGCLKTSYSNGTLNLTIPWVIEYLSMMDNLAPRLDYYLNLLYIILYIHRYKWLELREELTFSNFLVVSLISWLMENPVLPDGFFFSDIPDDVSEWFQDNPPSLASLDNGNFVDQSLLYKCCPYMGELKVLLVDFAVGSNSKVSAVKKITPVSADIVPQKSLTQRQLQLQMEDNFFHNHPSSMKRVVDFVADRTASNFIKKFRATLLLQSLTEGKELVLKQLTAIPEGSPSCKMKDRVKQVSSKVAQELAASAKLSVAVEAPKYCSEKVQILTTLLLPEDTSDAVNKMAAGIAERIAGVKIAAWINKHLNSAMYVSEITPEVDKVNKLLSQQQDSPDSGVTGLSNSPPKKGKELDQSIKAACHDESLGHPSELLIEFKDYMKNVVLRGHKLTEEKMTNLLANAKVVFSNRQDILPAIHRSFIQLTMEMLITLLIHQPDQYRDVIVNRCIELWSTVLHDTACLSSIFSGRIVCLIGSATGNKDVWSRYTDLLVKFYQNKLIDTEQLTQTGHGFIPHLKESSVIPLCHCLCKLASVMDELTRTEKLGSCLELLYNRIGDEQSPEAGLILETLGIINNNDGGMKTDDRGVDIHNEEADTEVRAITDIGIANINKEVVNTDIGVMDINRGGKFGVKVPHYKNRVMIDNDWCFGQV